jgi:hypothetical protein
MLYQDFYDAKITQQSDNGAQILTRDGHWQWVDKMDFSYASWYMATRTAPGSKLHLKIRAYVVKDSHIGVSP